MGLKIDAACLPYETKFLHQAPILWSCQSLRRINNMEAPLRCLIDSLYSSNLWGRKSWGKYLGEWNIWHETEFAPPKAISWGAHQEGSCESGILSFPSYYIFLTFEIKTLLVRGCLWWHTALVYHALWLQLLCPPSPRQWQAAWTSKKPGDCFVP